MTEQEYQNVRDLAWDLLADAKIDKLPVDIFKIAEVNGLGSSVSRSFGRYENALIVSREVLAKYGLSIKLTEHLAVRLMSPLIILSRLNINNPQELSQLTELPIREATKRFYRLGRAVKRDKFLLSGLEKRVLNNFSEWLNKQNI